MYKIVITKIDKKEFIDREYQKIADSGNERDDGAIYDYVEFPNTKSVESEVYTQKVEDLDIKQVIDAVNSKGAK